jgi:hypothetical protein
VADDKAKAKEATPMTPTTPATAAADGDNGAAPERRQNARLRVLVDEMLMSIRESQRRDDWTDAERARAEADLERIMAQVRRAAVDPDR